MRYLLKNEELHTKLSETDFRSLLVKRIEYLHEIAQLNDVSIDSEGLIHCFPSGITHDKGVHVVADLKFLNYKNDETVILIKYSIDKTQKRLILTTIIIQFLFVSVLFCLFIFGKFSDESFFFKLLVAIPILLISTLVFLLFSFNEQFKKISKLIFFVENKKTL